MSDTEPTPTWPVEGRPPTAEEIKAACRLARAAQAGIFEACRERFSRQVALDRAATASRRYGCVYAVWPQAVGDWRVATYSDCPPVVRRHADTRFALDGLVLAAEE